jgi:hypothetical protein
MVEARMVPRSVWRRLGAYEGWLEYYICVKEHLHDNCWLGCLTSSEGEQDGADGHASMGGGSEDDHVVLS